MLLKLIIGQVLGFILILFLCKMAIKLVHTFLLKTKYKLTERFSYLITCVITFSLAIVFGEEVIYNFL